MMDIFNFFHFLKYRFAFKFLILFSLMTLSSSLLIQAEEPSENKTILIAILARNKAHVLPLYLSCIENQDYDKKLISIYINTNNNEDKTEDILRAWAKKNENQYKRIFFESHEVSSIQSTKPHEWIPERFKVLAKIRNTSLDKAKEEKTHFYFVVDCDNFITPCTLKTLVKKDKPIIAPFLKAIPCAGDMYSNYFTGITDNGYYADHPDYGKIWTREWIGTFKVPVVHCTYLIKSEYLKDLNYMDNTDDYEFVIFSRTARNKNIDQYICNEKNFGLLLHFFDTLSLDEEVTSVQSPYFHFLLLDLKRSYPEKAPSILDRETKQP